MRQSSRPMVCPTPTCSGEFHESFLVSQRLLRPRLRFVTGRCRPRVPQLAIFSTHGVPWPLTRKETRTMKSNQRITGFLALCSVAILFVACVNQMEPAKNALDNINSTLSAVSADAQKYIPEQYAQAQGKVAALTASYEKKDYAAVIAGAPAV